MKVSWPVVACILAIGLAGCAEDSVPAAGQPLNSDVSEGANEVLPWAFVLNDPAVDAPERPDPSEMVTVPGSPVSIMRSDININVGPPDWHPDRHSPMPEIVARGRSGVFACGYCHLPNGQGKPENASLAGQPYAYLVQQLADYRAGLRRTGEPRMTPPSLMMTIGEAATPGEGHIAAEYFASLEFKPWIRVVETDQVPATRFSGWIAEVVEGGGTEPIGTRVIETPEDLARTKLRDDASSFVAYVPVGAVERGAALVLEGGGGRTVACTTCHGADLQGLGPVPALAGRSPTYMARQLYDFRNGNREGLWSELMGPAVANLTVEDVVDVVAYLASLDP